MMKLLGMLKFMYVILMLVCIVLGLCSSVYICNDCGFWFVRFCDNYESVRLELMMFLMISMLWLWMLWLRFLRICIMFDEDVDDLYEFIVMNLNWVGMGIVCVRLVMKSIVFFSMVISSRFWLVVVDSLW